jgi:long-subunit fatty acid transport protein
MVRLTVRIGVGALGLLAGLGAPHLAAQSWALPASDPVGIARSGTGVAFGNNLEAAGLNPALLATLRDGSSAYVAMGMEMESSQATLQSNGSVLYSSDRNRSLPAFGSAWRLNPTTVLGLKLDQPFLRHATMPLDYTGRFQGQAFNLKTHRLEGQLGWAASPNLAFGASLGVTRVQYSWDNQVRTVVPVGNSGGLMESDLHQEGAKIAPSYSFGFRWAPNSRWTVGGSYVSSIKTTLPLTASYGPNAPSFYALGGTGTPLVGTSAAGFAQQATTQISPGSGGITLPGKFSLGVRQRVNVVFTWEADLRYIMGSQTELPGLPAATPAGAAGPTTGPGQGSGFRSGLGLSLMGELSLSKNWTVRLGAALDPALRADSDVEPLVGGAKSSGLSGGFGYKVFGGEVNLGYQYRQSEDIDTPSLEGIWSSAGYAPTPASQTRVEGMGHLWSIGYKRSF